MPARPKTLKGILVDPTTRTIGEVPVVIDPASPLQALYDLIGCSLVQPVHLTPFETLWVDEEGLLKPRVALFSVGSGTLAGRAVILGNTGSGAHRDTKMTVEVVQALIKWPDLRFAGMTDDSFQHGDVFVVRRRANFEPR